MSCTLRISRAGFGCTSFFKPYAIYPATCNQMSLFIVVVCLFVVVVVVVLLYVYRNASGNLINLLIKTS